MSTMDNHPIEPTPFVDWCGIWPGVVNAMHTKIASCQFPVSRLLLYRVGVLLLTEDTRKRFCDASEAWRNGAMKGVYHNGTLVCDSRSVDRTIC